MLKVGIVFVAAIISLSGCSDIFSSLSQNNVLVLDLPAVAKATNRDEQIEKQIGQADMQLQAQLAKIKDEIEKNLKVAIGELKVKKEKKEATKLLEMEANQKMQSTVNEARQKIRLLQSELFSQFRKEIQPIVGKIAESRNASMVKIVDPSVIWFSDSADITDEVIAEIRSESNKHPPADVAAESN